MVWISTVDYVNAQRTGIGPGKKKLNYLSIPFLVRLNLGKYFTINGGPQLNVLVNKDKYKLDNGSEAFKKRYTNWGDGFENIGDRKDATISRFQLGVFIPILGK